MLYVTSKGVLMKGTLLWNSLERYVDVLFDCQWISIWQIHGDEYLMLIEKVTLNSLYHPLNKCPGKCDHNVMLLWRN